MATAGPNRRPRAKLVSFFPRHGATSNDGRTVKGSRLQRGEPTSGSRAKISPPRPYAPAARASASSSRFEGGFEESPSRYEIGRPPIFRPLFVFASRRVGAVRPLGFRFVTPSPTSCLLRRKASTSGRSRVGAVVVRTLADRSEPSRVAGRSGMIEEEGDAEGRDFAVGAWGGTQPAESGEAKDLRGNNNSLAATGKRGSIRRIQQRGNWTEENMKEAIKEVKKGTSSIGKIGEKYGIPESSIRDWLTGKTSSKKKGPRTVLSKEEEDSMVEWCLDMQRNGHSITFYMLRRKVADVCQGRETPFRNGVPGKSWMDWFRKRHPTVMIEAAHSLKGKKRNDTPRGRALLDGLIGREEDDGTKRDLFGATGSEPSPMESQDTRDIVLQLMQQEPHMDAQLANQMQSGMSGQMQNHLAPQMSSQLAPPPRPMETVNQAESTPAGYEPWKGQDRGNHEQDRDGAGGTSFDSEDSGSFPSSDSNPGGRWTDFLDGMAGLERAIRESEDRKDRRLERQLEANERVAASLIGALGQVSECLRSIGTRGLGGGDLGGAVSALGNLGGLSAELSAGLGDQQQT